MSKLLNMIFKNLLLESREGREKERERNTNVYTTMCCLYHTPNWGPVPQPGLGIKLTNSWSVERCQTNGDTLVRALNMIYKAQQGLASVTSPASLLCSRVLHLLPPLPEGPESLSFQLLKSCFLCLSIFPSTLPCPTLQPLSGNNHSSFRSPFKWVSEYQRCS